jgi:pre-mRNA-splicing factor SYF1
MHCNGRFDMQDKFVSKHGKTQHQLWVELCELLSRHAAEIQTVKAEPIIRAGIARFSDMVGRLWVSLAEYHTRRGHFGKVCSRSTLTREIVIL